MVDFWKDFYDSIDRTDAYAPAPSRIRPVSDPVRIDRMGVPLAPGAMPRETYVPPALEAFGPGTQMGFVPPGSHRLLPEQPAVAATTQVAKTMPDMRGMPLGFKSRDSMAQYDKGAKFAASVPAVHDLGFEPRSPDDAQLYADSLGRPVRTPSGMTYVPHGGGGFGEMGAKSPTVAPTAAKPSLLSLLLGGGSGGLASLLGGMAGPSRPSLAPAVAAQQAQGLTPSLAYAAAAAPAHVTNTVMDRWRTEGNADGFMGSRGLT